MRSLRTRLAAAIAAPALVAVGASAVVTAATTADAFRDDLRRRATAQADVVKTLTAAGAVAEGRWEDTAAQAADLAERYGLRIVLASLELQRYVDTGSGALPPMVGALDPYGPLAGPDAKTFDLSEYHSRLRACFDREGVEYRLAAGSSEPQTLAEGPDAEQCTLQAKADVAGTGTDKSPALLFLGGAAGPEIPWATVGAIAAALVAFAAAAAVLFGQVLTRPLQALLAGVRRVAGGDLRTRVPETAPAEIAALASSFNDMTARLARSDDQRRQLTADVGHELRSPITNIRNHLDAIDDGLLEPGPQVLSVLSSETDRLARLVNDLQTVTALDNEGLQIHPSTVDIAHLAEATAQARRARAEGAGVALVTRTPGPTLVQADSIRVEQILGNLIDNALDHASDGTVTITVTTDPDTVYIDVADTGPGITAEDLPQVFDRLWRRDPARSSAGRGLGLTIARSLARAHGGDIEATSTPAGASFRVTLLKHLPDKTARPGMVDHP